MCICTSNDLFPTCCFSFTVYSNKTLSSKLNNNSQLPSELILSGTCFVFNNVFVDPKKNSYFRINFFMAEVLNK